MSVKRSKKGSEGRDKTPTFVLVVIGLVVVAAAVFNLESLHMPNVGASTNWITSQATSILCDPDNSTNDGNIKVKVPVGGLFSCGYQYGAKVESLGKYLFPEFANNTDQLFHGDPNQARAPTEHDILIHGMHGPCVDYNQQHHHPLEFPGKILFVQGEAHGGDWTKAVSGAESRSPHHAIEGVYQIGMLPDTTHSILVYHGIISLWNDAANGRDLVSLVVDPTRKPKNTGEHAAIIYIARHCVAFREQAVGLLSTIFPVHYASECQGIGGRSIPAPDMPAIQSVGYANMQAYTGKYQFCLVMENVRLPFYLTEKIVFAFVAGCIPIYYGADDVFDVFNRHAFVFYNVSNPGPALEQMKYLKENHTAYLNMLNHQPILAQGEQTVRDYFSLSDDIGGGHLKHKLRTIMGIE